MSSHLFIPSFPSESNPIERPRRNSIIVYCPPPPRYPPPPLPETTRHSCPEPHTSSPSTTLEHTESWSWNTTPRSTIGAQIQTWHGSSEQTKSLNFYGRLVRDIHAQMNLRSKMSMMDLSAVERLRSELTMVNIRIRIKYYREQKALRRTGRSIRHSFLEMGSLQLQ